MIDLSTILTADARQPIYMQLVHGLRDAIAKGDIAQGSRLPSQRALAQDLGISRSTVIQSYEQLQAEGYLLARPGAGYFVADVATIAELSSPVPAKPTHMPPRAERLQPGAPDTSLFPTRNWARTIARVARNTPDALCRLHDAFGDLKLREEIAAYLGRWRGISCSPEQILVTSGAREALELAIELVIDGQDIGLESPGFVPLHRFAARSGWPIKWLNPGKQGPKLPSQLAKVTVLTPSHQFPLGGTLPVATRQAFLQAAHDQDAWIIEDDFDSEFRYAGQPVPAMAALDRLGRCLYVGTFSKTFSHEIRLGYLLLPAALITPMRSRFIHPSAGAGITAQRPLAHFMHDGQYDRHIRRTRRHYAERYEAAIAALSDWPTRWGKFQTHRAGMQIAYHLNTTTKETDIQICARAAAAGFAVGPLSRNDPVSARQGILIGFCGADHDIIGTEIAELGSYIEHSFKTAF
ncbi:aminotransferase class I/II-fold pyridoxal phosphate-dependent enzyme [Epibacterium sp. SM1969]|uniref:Aminotransferase class I/II-fold pyridoxal phosphate-dependent enzyme n=1 Tax=Tritonibacter aquimaris TaxID=2663379 RepID=A0A844AMX4_9RHOB|nr:PLP-dependent aminotransferase family protein [Tritonibacter aquimaris]MQY43760.1 aminotransferase class I/II-fold pyridoxal phosphate-dependent enzyme [Tritonibacter aquimaris]